MRYICFLAIFFFLPHILHTKPRPAESPPLKKKAKRPAAKKPSASKSPRIQSSSEKKSPIDRVRLVLKYGTSEHIRKALAKLVTFKEAEQKEFIPQLEEILKSENVINIRKVVEIIGGVSFTEMDAKIIPFLEHEANEIFFTAINTIQKKKIKEALGTLHKLILASDFTELDNKTADLLHTLVILKDTSKAKFLIEKMKSKKTINEYKRRIMRYLAKVNYQKKETLDFLLHTLEDEDENVKNRSQAAHALGTMQIAQASKTLRKQFDKIERIVDLDKKNSFRGLRASIVYALVQLKDKKAKKVLNSMAREDDEYTRLKALKFIEDIGGKEFRELLEYQSKFDPSTKVQRYAKKVLEKLK